jgi:ATP-binding cassette subfamily C protein PrsD
MAMVLYEGKAIAFGPCEEIFARIRESGQPVLAARAAAARTAPQVRRAAVAEGV